MRGYSISLYCIFMVMFLHSARPSSAVQLMNQYADSQTMSVLLVDAPLRRLEVADGIQQMSNMAMVTLQLRPITGFFF